MYFNESSQQGNWSWLCRTWYSSSRFCTPWCRVSQPITIHLCISCFTNGVPYCTSDFLLSLTLNPHIWNSPCSQFCHWNLLTQPILMVDSLLQSLLFIPEGCFTPIVHMVAITHCFWTWSLTQHWTGSILPVFQLEELEVDFRYNFNLLEQRDHELQEYEKALATLTTRLARSERELAGCNSSLAEAQSGELSVFSFGGECPLCTVYGEYGFG